MTEDEIRIIENIFGRIESLPTLPSLALDVMMLAENPNSSLADIALLIQKGPSMASKILKIANSSFYGYSQKVNNLQSALLILGLREVKNIVLGISILNLFKQSKNGPGFNHELFWIHSAGCGQVARSLAAKTGLFEHEMESFTIGLIHDIGKIVIDQFSHDNFIKILHLIQQEHLTFLEAEVQVLGVNHAQIGSWLTQKWLFPPGLVEAIEYHHNPEKSKNSQILSSLTHIADIFCKSKDLSFIEEFRGESITDNSGWKIIQKKSSRKNLRFDIERFVFELDDEIFKAQQFINISRGTDI